MAHAPNKVETARLLSDMAGSTTVHKETRTYTGNRLNPVLMHVMTSEQESHRPLLTPDEAMRLPDDATLIFTAGARPILGEKLRYYEHEEFVKRARIPPPGRSDQVPIRYRAWRPSEAPGPRSAERSKPRGDQSGQEPDSGTAEMSADKAVSSDGTTAPATLGDIEEILRPSSSQDGASPDTGTEQ